MPMNPSKEPYEFLCVSLSRGFHIHDSLEFVWVTIAISSLEIACPSNTSLRTAIAHLAGLRLNLVMQHFCKHFMCSRSVLKRAKSSKNTCMKFSMNSSKISITILWNVVDTFFNPNIMITTTKTPHSFTKALLLNF